MSFAPRLAHLPTSADDQPQARIGLVALVVGIIVVSASFLIVAGFRLAAVAIPEHATTLAALLP